MSNSELIKKYLNEFSHDADKWFQDATFLEERFNFFNNFFKKENLRNLEWNEIQKLGENLHCFSTNALAKKRAFGSLNHKIEHYRESFNYLAYGSDEPRRRIDNLSDKNGKYRLKYISDSAISELISYIMPDKYTFFNSRSRQALKLLGIEVKSEKKETLGDKFEYFSEAIKPVNELYNEIVGKKTKLPLSFEIDQFFSYLYEKHNEEIEKNENSDDVNFWVFQGNPKVYDVSKALNDNMIHEWWVKSHKEKINIGDKGIIWVTGPESGCYAFFKVTTEIYEAGEDEEQEQYYHTEMKNIVDTKVGIEIEENIANSPILKESVKNLDWFQDFKGGTQGTTFQMTKKEYEGFMNMKNLNKGITLESSNIMKNTILFGPPGTGKTYKTVERSVEICNPEFYKINREDRKKIKEEYERLVEDEQIVFATFHQSMSYEDFIEGIKPIDPDQSKGQIGYRTKSGIFKDICDSAKAYSGIDSTRYTSDKELEFSSLYDQYVGETKRRLQNNETVELKNKSGDSVFVYEITDNDNFSIKHKDGSRSYTVSKNRLSKLYNEIDELDKVENINKVFRSIIGGSNSTAYWSVLSKLLEYKKSLENLNIIKSKKQKNFVLIIDEINRGNVSQVFGELITLLEPEKRLGQPEEIVLQLTYSKEIFGVPSNLYIIGTMNTADRSIEALDTALRRRFSFEEMAPDIDVIKEKNPKVDDIDLVKLLETINKRIEVLLNKDHLIGHSFFLKVKKIEDLKHSFRNEIIPLLQEYFYGDFGKIGLVLGEKFITSTKAHSSIFARFSSYESSDYDDRPIYQITNFKDNNGNELDNNTFKIMVKSIYE